MAKQELAGQKLDKIRSIGHNEKKQMNGTATHRAQIDLGEGMADARLAPSIPSEMTTAWVNKGTLL